MIKFEDEVTTNQTIPIRLDGSSTVISILADGTKIVDFYNGT